jgi:hypothetical protein
VEHYKRAGECGQSPDRLRAAQRGPFLVAAFQLLAAARNGRRSRVLAALEGRLADRDADQCPVRKKPGAWGAPPVCW